MRRIAVWTVVTIAVGTIAFLALRPSPLAVDIEPVTRQDIRAYVSEDAKTRLHDKYAVDMPISGTLERIALEVGDRVEKGQPLAHIDPFDLEQQIKGLEALVEQARAQIRGVDVAKPKPEDFASAALRVKQSKDSQGMAGHEYDTADINLTEAKRNYERLKALREQGAVSQAQLDDAERVYKGLIETVKRLSLAEKAAGKTRQLAELADKRVNESVNDNEYQRDVHRADMERLASELAVLKGDLEKTTVTAPVAGVVLDKYVEDTRVLSAGTPVLNIGDLDSIEIESDILSEEIGSIEVGDPVEITGKALDDRVIPGKVKQIYPGGFMKVSALGIEQQRVKILIEFDNAPLKLRPGTSVDVRVVTDERKDTLVVPERATFRHEGNWAVFVVRDGRARLRPVKIGIKNDQWAEILEGLEPQDRVIAETKNELNDGVRVVGLYE